MDLIVSNIPFVVICAFLKHTFYLFQFTPNIDENYRKNIERRSSEKQTKRSAPYYCRNINHNQRRFFKNSDNVQGQLKLRSIE